MIISPHWRRFRCPACGSTSVSMSPTSLGSPRVSRRVHCHHLRADVTRSAATGHPRPRALDPPARARIPQRAREPPTRGDNTCGGERGSVPLLVGLTNREPCPRVVRIAGNAFLSSKPRFDRGKIRLQCKVMTSNVIRTSVNEGVQPRERRSDSAERRSTSRKRSKRSGYSEELRTTLPRD